MTATCAIVAIFSASSHVMPTRQQNFVSRISAGLQNVSADIAFQIESGPSLQTVGDRGCRYITPTLLSSSCPAVYFAIDKRSPVADLTQPPSPPHHKPPQTTRRRDGVVGGGRPTHWSKITKPPHSPPAMRSLSLRRLIGTLYIRKHIGVLYRVAPKS